MTLTADAQASIDRILSRLDQGEQLGKYGLRTGAHFCIMGLFADESRLGTWTVMRESSDFISGYITDPEDSARFAFPPDSVTEYYGLNNGSGTFHVSDLPPDLYIQLEELVKLGDRTRSIESLANINDVLTSQGVTAEVVNGILARIIRTGIIFKKQEAISE